MSGSLRAVAFRTSPASPSSRLLRGSLAVVALGFGGLVLLLAAPGRANGVAPAGDAWAGARAAVLCQVALVALVAPALGVQSLMRERQRNSLRLLFSSRWGVNRILLTRLLPPALSILALLLASALPLWLVSLGAGPAALGSMLLSQLELALLALALVALGALGGAVFRELATAVAAVYLVVALLLAAPFLVGPAVAQVPNADRLIGASLLASPLVGIAAAVDFDLLRTERVYRLNPIGQRRFTYPAAPTVVSGLLFAALACYAAAAGLLARERWRS